MHDNGPDLCICYLREPPTFFYYSSHLGAALHAALRLLAAKKNPKINRIIRNNLLRIFEILGFVELILQIRCAFDTQQYDCQGVFQCKENKKHQVVSAVTLGKSITKPKRFNIISTQWVYHSLAGRVLSLSGLLF